MKVQTCDISGLLIIDPKVFGDARGFFLETWNLLRYRERISRPPLSGDG